MAVSGGPGAGEGATCSFYKHAPFRFCFFVFNSLKMFFETHQVIEQ